MALGLLFTRHRPSLFFNAAATTAFYSLSLHDAFRSRERWPLDGGQQARFSEIVFHSSREVLSPCGTGKDRKSTRLNSSHRCISYAVFCLKKKNRRQPDCIERWLGHRSVDANTRRATP